MPFSITYTYLYITFYLRYTTVHLELSIKLLSIRSHPLTFICFISFQSAFISDGFLFLLFAFFHFHSNHFTSVGFCLHFFSSLPPTISDLTPCAMSMLLYSFATVFAFFFICIIQDCKLYHFAELELEKIFFLNSNLNKTVWVQ